MISTDTNWSPAGGGGRSAIQFTSGIVIAIIFMTTIINSGIARQHEHNIHLQSTDYPYFQLLQFIALFILKITIDHHTIQFTSGVDAIVAGGGGGGGSGNTAYWNPTNTGPLGYLILSPIRLSNSFTYHQYRWWWWRRSYRLTWRGNDKWSWWYRNCRWCCRYWKW